MTIAEKLLAFRVKHDLSYRKMAKLMGRSRSTVYELEKGRRGCYPRTERRIELAIEQYESEQLP